MVLIEGAHRFNVEMLLGFDFIFENVRFGLSDVFESSSTSYNCTFKMFAVAVLLKLY